MSRYTGPSYKKARRVGFSISETGKELARRPYGPGQHGNERKGKFKKTFTEAGKMQGIHGTNFLRLLESRLDNLVYRIGFASTRRGARQLVSHGHVTVNGKKVNIPSYRVKPGDVISLKDDDKNLKVVAESLAKVSKRVEFINYDEGKMEATYVRLPERNELNADINEALIVEFYNK